MPATVAVVGSGAAGLAAAFRLREAGFGVRLLERAEYPGGRMRTVRRDGFMIEEGPSGLTRGHTSVLGIAEAAGLGPDLVAASSTVGIVAAGDTVHRLDARHLVRDGLRTTLVSTRAKLALGRLVVDLVRYRDRLDVEDLSRMAGIDHLSAERFARERYGDEVFERVLDPCVRPLVIGRSADLSAADLLTVFSAFLTDPDFVAFRHGMGSYPERLAPLFDTVLGAEVTEVTETGDAVTLRWRDRDAGEHRERFAGAVLACGPRVSARIHAGLDPWRREFLRDGVRMRSLVHVNLAVGTAPDSPACYLFPIARHHPRLVGVTLEHNKATGRAPAGKGVIGIYPTPDWADQLADEPDEVIVKNLVDEVEPIIPGLGGAIEFTHLTRLGTAVLNSYPGYWSAMADFHRRGRGHDHRIQLAGDYFCTSSVNAASASGERAARALRAAVAPD